MKTELQDLHTIMTHRAPPEVSGSVVPVFDRGYSSFEHGFEKTDNPYGAGSVAWEIWDLGFETAATV